MDRDEGTNHLHIGVNYNLTPHLELSGIPLTPISIRPNRLTS